MNLLSQDGEVYLFQDFFSEEDRKKYFKSLLEDTPWEQKPIKLFGKEVMQPRLTAWFSDEGMSYRYSGLTMNGHVWTPILLKIKERIEEKVQVRFNGVLLNLYRNHDDSMGWHRDNEKELGPNPVIGSVSLGATRRFLLRHCERKDLKVELELKDGSFLLMKGKTQHFWQHSVPKESSAAGPRINLTFRIIK